MANEALRCPKQVVETDAEADLLDHLTPLVSRDPDLQDWEKLGVTLLAYLALILSSIASMLFLEKS